MAAAPAGYCLDSVRVGQTDVAAAEAPLFSSAFPITVLFKSGGGTVHGAVEKCALGTVLLVPVAPDMRWWGFLHSVRCDAKDHYEITTVHPGAYYAVAFAGQDSSPTLDPGVLQQARTVNVKLGEAATADFSPILQ